MEQEKKDRWNAVVKQVSKMSPEARKELAAKIPITTCEGHPLSPYNNCLICYQGGHACTLVGGFSQWKKQGRSVSKGEHGYMILFPGGSRKAETTADEVNPDKPWFMTGYVFDISQTHEIEQVV
jgi:hypothetical protein